ncbi:putative F-box protein At1g58310 [Lactuca sativa]|uniref:putative F-box protein At1g58310 n=1 Tax=Lactuca sativa TaxID=4236 RepID=UPI000CB065F2|nr:putative F-box protein At1g58310 [Lactuca sativa]
MKPKKLPMSKYRGNKQHEIEHSCDMVDHISNLPDCILHQILSFMHTKEAVKTSILSTRWKYLWVSVPKLDIDDAVLYPREIDDKHPSKVTSFMNFVGRVLRMRDASNLEKFSLICRISSDASQIKLWISDAISHNVRELDLCIVDMISSVLPKSMFCSMSLTSLKLEVEWIKIPPHVSFPCLKNLHLDYVGFLNDGDAERLFSGCHVLEKLVLSYCQWIHLNHIVISISTLKSLTIFDDSDFEPEDDDIGCKIKIIAAKLTCFEYIGHLSNEILLSDIPSLVRAYIHISLPEERQNEVTCRAVDLLKQLRNVMALGLSNVTMESLIFTDMPLHLPVFPNLINLTLTKEIENYTFGAVMNLLYFCPNLQFFGLSEGFENSMDLGEEDRVWLLVPICMTNCLKIVTFKNFHATDSEICFLKRVLKYATVLERMNICWSKTQVGERKKETDVIKEFEKVESSSAVFVVRFT